jgi:indolepyruvate ferredoxin oxidoreductase alpha subunit
MAAAMPQMAIPPAASRLLLSGNEAVARAVWDAGVRVAAAYPGTPSTEILEVARAIPTSMQNGR